MARSVAIALLVLLAAAGPAPDWSSPKQVTVITNEYHFVPDHLTFQRGTVYRLRLVNQGKELHAFTARALFAASTIRRPKLLVNGGVEISVPVGDSVDFDFIPNQPGQYELTCADHDWAGMVGKIEVK